MLHFVSAFCPAHIKPQPLSTPLFTRLLALSHLIQPFPHFVLPPLHLHVGAAESEQLDLLCACGRIGIVHVDGRVGGETLAEIAAGGTQQFAGRDHLRTRHADTLHPSFRAGRHRDIAQRLRSQTVIVRHVLSENGQGTRQ